MPNEPLARSVQESSTQRPREAIRAYPATVADPSDIAGLWRIYARHAEAVLSAGPAPRTIIQPGSFVAMSGAPHVDLNQAVIFGAGDRRDAGAIADAAQRADVPCLLGISSTVRDDVSGVLRDAGFEPLLEREALFFAPAVPPTGPSAFQVRRAMTARDRAGIEGIFAASHEYDPDLVSSMWGPRLLDRDDVGGWVAWDGEEPVSCVFVTRVGGSLGFFDMMTPARHRRRGAARAVLTQALADAAGLGDPPDAIVFWSSPFGRPLYESLGFSVADTLDVWTLGASPEDLAAVGAG